MWESPLGFNLKSLQDHLSCLKPNMKTSFIETSVIELSGSQFNLKSLWDNIYYTEVMTYLGYFLTGCRSLKVKVVRHS